MVALLLAILMTMAVANAQGDKPNIVILLADDLGWGDVSYHGGEIRTPNIDNLAREGVELDRFYVAPVCSPTRAGLMTGRWPIRFGLMRTVFPPWRQGGLDTSETTLAEVLGQAGYEHRGIFGKWHLGHSDIKYHPLRRGFTEFMGHYNGAIDYFTHDREAELDWHRGYESNYDKGYTTDLIADAAVSFIKEHAKGAAPFFCYVPFNAPHAPFQAKPEDAKAYEDLEAVPGEWPGNVIRLDDSGSGPERRRDSRRILGGMIAALDYSVGRVLEAVEETGEGDSTLVLFFSDNGGVRGIGSNAPLREGKATTFEGGIRVPAAIRWPDGFDGGRKLSAPLAFVDVLPTLMRILDIQDHGGKPLDGIDALDLLTGAEDEVDREIYSYTGAGGEETEQVSYTDGEWKLMVTGPSLADRRADSNRRKILLFQILEDPNETTNLANRRPDVASKMLVQAKKFRELQPPDGLPPYDEGREGFVAPKEWLMPGK